MSNSQSRFLDFRALEALGRKRFATRQQIEGSYSGRHRSRVLGGAGEFVDYREYAEGEDLRRLDWKVLARTGRAYLRVYQDETNLRCTTVVDASGSMGFGNGNSRANRGTKLEYVQYLATAMSAVISGQQDQVGLAVIGDGLQKVIEPVSTPSQVAGLQDAIAALTPGGPSRLDEGLGTLFGRLTRRGVLVIMSDFLVDDLDRVFAAVRLFRHRHWEVIVLHIVHPEEERLPDGLAYRFEGMENDGITDCSPADIRQLYERQFNTHMATVRASALAAGCDYRRVSTAISYLETLGGFLMERAM